MPVARDDTGGVTKGSNPYSPHALAMALVRWGKELAGRRRAGAHAIRPASALQSTRRMSGPGTAKPTCFHHGDYFRSMLTQAPRDPRFDGTTSEPIRPLRFIQGKRNFARIRNPWIRIQLLAAGRNLTYTQAFIHVYVSGP